MEKILLTEKDVEDLREKVKPYLTEKRYLHTLAVEKEADALGEIYLPNERIRLRAAALLHDITKKADYDRQLLYCDEFGLTFENGSDKTPEVYHALTGAALAKKDFPDYTDDEIISAVRRHTTGSADMTLFDAIIYLADYIEETRTFEGCRQLRSYFYDRIECGDDKTDVLTDTLVRSFDMTITHLIEKVNVIDPETIGARNACVTRRIFRDIEVTK